MIYESTYKTYDIDVEKLEVSRTNPRFVQTVIDEEAAIALLINLETKKMIKLVKSVVDRGLLPITFYAFKEQGKIVLADGNRRLTVIKILNNPNLIPSNSKTKELIDLCNHAKEVQVPKSIPCVVYDSWSDELFDVLSSLHVSDESKADWSPLAQYRMSARHGGSKHSWMKTLLFYFTNDEVDSMTTRKADVFRRMFDAINQTDELKIAESGELNVTNAKEKLIAFSKIIKSDLVNTRTSQDVFKEQVRKVFVDGQTPLPAKYQFLLNRDYIYQSQNFDLNLLGLRILTEQGTTVKYGNNEVQYSFIDENGNSSTSIDTSIKGSWQLCVTYDNFSSVINFRIIDRKETVIVLTANRVSIKLGNSVNLRKYILSATNSFGDDVSNKVKIKKLGFQNIQIENEIFPGDAIEDTYTIQYSYKDKYGECSKTLYLEVTNKEDFSPLTGKIVKTNLLSWGLVPVIISYDNTVASLINEINKLNFEEYPNVISCACRSILEISYDVLVAYGKTTVQADKRTEFIEKIKLIILTLSSEENLKKIYYGDPITFNSYKDELNFLRTFDDGKLKSFNGLLNSAAHKASMHINLAQLEECIRKDISRLVALINQLLK